MALPPFHLAPGLTLDVSDPHVIDVRYPGDVTLQTTLGRQLGQVAAGGDLTINLPLVTGTLVAGGTIDITGDVDAIRVSGDVVVVRGGNVRARALTASERLILGPCKLKVDVLLAPIIEIHSEATGRVTVIESRNERGPNKVKGGFSVREYDEVFGDAEEFLRQRGVAPLGRPRLDDIPAPTLRIVPLAEDDETLHEIEPVPVDDEHEPPSDGLVEIEPEPLDDGEEDELETIDTLEPLEETPRPAPVRTVPPVRPPNTARSGPNTTPRTPTDLGDPAEEDDGIIQAVRPLPPRARTPIPPPARGVEPVDPAFDGWFARVDDLVERITGAYEYPPEPVLELRGLAETRRIDALEHGLNPVWSDLLRHHRQTRARIHPMVSHGFRVLSDLIAQAPGR